MPAVEMKSNIYWIGVNDRTTDLFEGIWPISHEGVSYNAYLIKDEKNAIIDLAKAFKTDEFFDRISEQIDIPNIDYVIMNHLEPDHSGALPQLMERAPQARLYISQRATSMLKCLLKPLSEEFEYTTVVTDDRVSLGDRTLRFLHTPFLHWPDTQCTYLEEEQVLFSGDVFGCHFCDARLFNDKVGDFRFSFDYYYAHIMRPFKQHVLNALDLIEPLPLNIIAPTHGPILRDRPARYVKHYRELSTSSLSGEIGDNEKSLMIFYMSSYGNTARMAEAIYAGADEVDGVRVSLFDLEGGEYRDQIVDVGAAGDVDGQRFVAIVKHPAPPGGGGDFLPLFDVRVATSREDVLCLT